MSTDSAQTGLSVPRVRCLERRVLSDAWATLEAVDFDYRHADGRWERQRREIYHRGHGVAILPCDPDRRCVLLVRQFRLPVVLSESPPGHAGHGLEFDQGFILEVPAGIVEPEGAEATALAELWQEVGLRPRDLQFVCRAYVSPGSVTECLHHFIAMYGPEDRESPGGGLAEEGEDIEVIEYPFDQAMESVKKGDIVDAKTILLLQHAALSVF